MAALLATAGASSPASADGLGHEPAGARQSPSLSADVVPGVTGVDRGIVGSGHSLASLRHVQRRLDRFARTHDVGEVRGWYVDARRHVVVVTTPDHRDSPATARFLKFARRAGDRVAVERTRRASPAPANNLYGGQLIHLTNRYECTIGFNAVTARSTSLLLTAGHCAQGSPRAWRGRYAIGGTYGYSYPGNDFAALINNYPRFWRPRGAVDLHDGYARVVRGVATPRVGSRVCSSGRTSGWSCGVIEAYNQTVNYGNGDIVYGLVRYSACVEPGDSGGAVMTGNYAVGLISGGQFQSSGGGRMVCGQKVGYRNVSFYQPIGEVLKAFNATLVTQ